METESTWSQWALGLGASLTKLKRTALPRLGDGKSQIEYACDGHSLWLFLHPAKGLAWAWRTCYDPAGILKLESHKRRADGGYAFALTGGIGSFQVEVVEPLPEVLHVSTWLTPAQSVHILSLPRDLYVLGSGSDPAAAKGDVWVQQRGPSAGLVYFSQQKPAAATGFYFQNLTALNDYFQATEGDPGGIVGGAWPELGLALPASKKPLVKAVRVCLSDAYLRTWERQPANEVEAANWFMQAMAGLYPLLPRPETNYVNWPATAGETLRALTISKACRRLIKGGTYLNAYVGTSEKPPESMVHLSIVVPLLEYANWLGRKPPLLPRLLKSMPAFFDKGLGTVVRWLPGQTFRKKELSEEEDTETMDSWYLYHVLVNLGQLAQLGQREAEEMFLASLDYAIRVARTFKYHWPVFFAMSTLEVIKKETEPGKGGEFDVPGLYAKAMVIAYRLTKKEEYLQEACTAAQVMKGRGFDLLYQTNNTITSAVGLLWLWQETADRQYLDLSRVCLANIAAKFWLWSGSFGNSSHYSTFMGVSPLHDGSYISAYEEAESLASAMAYMLEAREELTNEENLLLSEYIKYVLYRGQYYYPANLPEDIVSESPKEGYIDRRLMIPLEDIGTGWERPGQVGQEVYGSATAFVMSSHAYLRRKQVPFLTWCEYPILVSDYLRQGVGKGSLHLRLGGSPLLTCRMRLLPVRTNLPAIRLFVLGEQERQIEALQSEPGLRVFELPGGCRVRIEWETRS